MACHHRCEGFVRCDETYSEPKDLSDKALELRKTAHKALDSVSNDIEALRFNRAVAQIYEYTNTLSSNLAAAKNDLKPDMAFALKEATNFLIHGFGPMMPHLAEQCWAHMGNSELLAKTPWPDVNKSLLKEDSITIAVQVNGKRRSELTISLDASKDEIEKAALELDGVQKMIDGKNIRKIIVVPQKIVNIVAN